APVPAAAFTQNGYSGMVLPNSQSDLHGQSAFVQDSPNFTNGPLTSIAILGTFHTNDTIRVQFIAASDTNTRGNLQPNWQIDSLSLSAFATKATTVAGVAYGESSNIVVVSVSPDFVPDTNTYFVTVTDVHDLVGASINPNPTTCQFIQGGEFPLFHIL